MQSLLTDIQLLVKMLVDDNDIININPELGFALKAKHMLDISYAVSDININHPLLIDRVKVAIEGY